MHRNRRIRSLSIAISALLAVSLIAPTDDAVAARPKKPSVSKVAPATGPLKGGTRVTVTGKNFRKVKAVTFGGTAGGKIKVLSTTRLQVTAPRRGAGYADVRVKTSAGTSKTTRADRFRYVAAPNVRNVTASSGSTDGGNTVTLTGTSFVGVRSIVFGSTRSTKISVKSETTITARVPAGTAGTVHVRVTTAYGTSPVVAADRYSYLPSWRGVQTVLPRTGGITDMSCPVSDFCAAADENGAVAQFRDGEWQPPRLLDAPPAGTTVADPRTFLSCTSQNFCVAAGSGGAPFRWDGKTWKSMAIGSAGVITSVECSDRERCFLTTAGPVNGDGQLWRFDGATWSQEPGQLGTSFSNLACTGGGACYVIAGNQTLLRYDGSWSASSAPAGLSGLACPYDNRCIGVTYQGDSYRYTYDADTRTHTWTGPTDIPGVDSSGSPEIDCTSPTDCVVTVHDDVYTYDGTSWLATPVPMDVPRGPVCTVDGICRVYDETQVVDVAATAGRTADSYRGGINDVDCATPTFCVAVGDGERTAVMRGTTWTAAPLPFRRDLVSVSCPTTSFCLAVGNYGTMQYDGTAWRVRKGDPSDLREVSCASPNYCVAMSYDDAYLLTDGVWTPHHVTGTRDNVHASCAAETFCMVWVGDEYATVTNGVWSATSDLVPKTYSGFDLPVSCTSATMCIAVSNLSVAWRWNGSTWARSADLATGSEDEGFDVSCATTTACTVSYVDIYGVGVNGIWSYDGKAWTGRQKVGLVPSNISCATATSCIASDFQGNAQAYR